MTDTAELQPPRARRRLPARALSGLLAAAVVLGVGELVAILIDPASSPFFAVGSTTVDRTPAWAREFAIHTFGTNDKPALFIGMTILIVLLSMGAGLLERPRRPIGSAMLVLFGLVGVYAALSRPTADALFAVPTVAGVIAGVATLRLLVGALPPAGIPPAGFPPATPDGALPRRQFMALAVTATAIAGATWAAGRYLGGQLRSVTADRLNFRIPFVKAADAAAPIPAGTDVGVTGATTFVTPNDTFYRIDTALQVPRLTTGEWQLRIHGMVDRELTLSWDDLARRTPIERVVTLTCVSNEVGGPLAGNATWVGYPMRELLAEAGVHPDADMLLSTSVDGFTCGTPVEVLMDGRDAMLAVAMNGQPLPLEHGYPVRQVVPGLYGFVSATKWVVDWELTRFDRAQAYWTTRGWGEKAPIKTASRIDVPTAFAPVVPGRLLVAGTAWAQHRGIEKVEVRVDNGSWQLATLAAEYSIDTWRQWWWDWEATDGSHVLEVRATDLDGNTQVEERTPPIPGGATGWHRQTVLVR
ncbi:molybdopterin-dependent oxidoreductase [Tomitella biformata]|uniref:molybdopterin-dependent oxidoreductase n=1 Tax=Tomitella biformata TaxID=630403 RepID=UPI000465E48C|nr:molybdopterin-dependent oxidoreductase [Tomitella biformata]